MSINSVYWFVKIVGKYELGLAEVNVLPYLFVYSLVSMRVKFISKTSNSRKYNIMASQFSEDNMILQMIRIED